MSWLLLTIASAVLLGFYDYFKKVALRDNAVLPVLFGSVVAGAILWLPFMLVSAVAPERIPLEVLRLPSLSTREHGLLFVKAALVGSSWLFGYFGIRSLPLSIATPIRATGPLWTIGLAVLLLHESPTPKQWLGVSLILTAFFAFSLIGRREGIHFHRDKGVFLMIGATLLGATSSLYDKFLLQHAALTPGQVQAWFTCYTAVILVPPMILWWRLPNRHPFHWHISIPAIGVTLLAADLLYFTAISQPGALISLISPVRRASVVVSFLLGIILFGEKHARAKAICVAAIVGGLVLLA